MLRKHVEEGETYHFIAKHRRNIFRGSLIYRQLSSYREIFPVERATVIRKGLFRALVVVRDRSDSEYRWVPYSMLFEMEEG